jgi:simple sugar transport system ATP-binding protein
MSDGEKAVRGAGEGAARGAAVVCRGVTKRFGAVLANDGVDLEVAAGEIAAIVGENGAGKSTLMKMLAGLYPPDSGEITLFGEKVTRFTPAEAISRGVGMVHQHFMLVGDLSVAENVTLGRELRRGPWLDARRAADEVAALGARYGLAVDPEAKVDALSVGEKQRVEILKVLYRGAELFIFDEPTAVLSPPEIEGFCRVVRNLAAAGKTAILITHKLDEVMAVSNRITVLRGGRVVGKLETAATTPKEIAKAMVGREVLLSVERKEAPAGPPEKGLRVEGLSARGPLGALALDGVSFAVAPGEILGVAGVEGNGQAELALVISGLLKPEAGKVSLGGADISRLSARARLSAGLAHIPEDRHARGLVLEMPIEENLLLGGSAGVGPAGVLSRGKIRADAEEKARSFDIRPPDPALRAAGLSGGNQQKIVIARELSRPYSALIAAQPTRGVDVGAIEFIHRRLIEAKERGKAVLLISADLDEILALSDRVLVLYRGKIAGECARRDATREGLGAWMVGAGDAAKRAAAEGGRLP